MPTPEAEEIIKTAWSEAASGADALSVVQRHAPRIDALCLRLISANEEAWRRTVRLEREARIKAEAEANRFRLLSGGSD
jgi:hypothetical protein